MGEPITSSADAKLKDPVSSKPTPSSCIPSATQGQLLEPAQRSAFSVPTVGAPELLTALGNTRRDITTTGSATVQISRCAVQGTEPCQSTSWLEISSVEVIWTCGIVKVCFLGIVVILPYVSSFFIFAHCCNVPLIGSACELFQRGRIIDERTLPRRRVAQPVFGWFSQIASPHERPEEVEKFGSVLMRTDTNMISAAPGLNQPCVRSKSRVCHPSV